jgi:hypothetical protein
MSLGESFINVFDPTGGRSDDELLGTALSAIGAEPRPCTFWISRVATVGGTVTFPPSVTLSFAPGARLVVLKRLTLQGFLDAGLEARFEVRGDGIVELLGPLEEIVADWWVPSQGLSPVEHALRALWSRYAHAGEGVLPAPIRLDGPYELSRTLRVLPPAELTGRVDVVLRGQHGRSLDPPTFVMVPVPTATMPWSMLSIEAGVVLTMENVAFDADPGPANAHARSCVSLEGTFHGSRIEACSFRFGIAGVLVSPRVQQQREAAAAAGGTSESVARNLLEDAIELSTTSTNRLEVSRCLFTGVSLPAGAFDGARGIDIGLGAPTALTLRDSQFVGAFANGVAIIGGELDVTACQFANETARPFFHGSVAATADVLVRRWGDDDEAYDLRFAPKDWPILRPDSRKDVANVDRGIPLANTHATIIHCISTSPVFLVMFQAFSYSGTILGGAVLTNVRHSPSSAARWNSVVLGPGMPPRALILQGCRFGDSVLLDATGPADVVVDLGTRINARPAYTLGTAVGPAGVITLRSPGA